MHVGGSVHIIVNNLIGFTTVPQGRRLVALSSDLAKRLPIPIFHVNAEDPEAVVRVGRMALDYRYEFGTPVVIDLIGYRRHGHSEVDDPDDHAAAALPENRGASATCGRSTRKKSAPMPSRSCERVREELDAAQKEAHRTREKSADARAAALLGRFPRRALRRLARSGHGVTQTALTMIGEALSRATPRASTSIPKVKKLLEQRLEMAQGKRALDFGMAEALAFGSLLKQGVPVRLERAGQPARHVQPAARRADRYRDRGRNTFRCEHLAPGSAWL